MMTTTVKALMTTVSASGKRDMPPRCANKVAVIGAGTCGTAIAFSLLAKQITANLVLIDEDENLARGEMLDIQHATMYLESPDITSTSDYGACENSKICIVTAGAGLDECEEKDLVTRNTDIFRGIIPQITRNCPDCILIIVAQPVDILTYVAWKLSAFPPHKVIGSGTMLESARFRYLLSEKLGVCPGSLQAFVIGEHGKNCVPVWSGVTLSGVRLKEVNTELGTDSDPEDWPEIFKQVVESAREVLRLKSCPSWGISLSVSRLVKAILFDTKECFPLSTYIKGCRHGVDKDVFMSLPCVLGHAGVNYIVKQNLNEREKEMLQESADSMNEILKPIRNNLV